MEDKQQKNFVQIEEETFNIDGDTGTNLTIADGVEKFVTLKFDMYCRA